LYKLSVIPRVARDLGFRSH